MNLFNVADHFALNFVHKRLLGAAKGFLGGGPGAALGGFFRGEDDEQFPVRRPPPRTKTARPTVLSASEKEFGRVVKFGPARRRGAFRTTSIVGPTSTTDCTFPAIKVGGKCVDPLAFPPGGRPFVSDITHGGLASQAVMGRYGAAYVPGSMIVDRAVCLPGDVVGDDGFCYAKASLKNSERQWPRGRRPLLTGGDMRAISVASRAAHRLTHAAVRLQEIGLIKKPIARKPPRKKSAHH